MADTIFTHKVKPWEPMVRVQMDLGETARALKLVEAQGQKLTIADEIWANEEYNCFVHYLNRDLGRAGVVHLSIKRTDFRPVQDWREKQAIKNEVIGWEREAVEVYPAESRLVDEADQAHLWVLPAGEDIGIGFGNREVKTDVERRASLAAVDDVAATKGSQREWRPGISTGPNYKPGG